MRVIPSIASASMLQVGALLQKLGDCGSLHIDIEDGNFIPNITFGMKMVQEIAAAVKLPLNAHLMVTDPLRYIAPLAECGVTEIAIHIESCPYPLLVLQRANSFGMKAGLAFNFVTPIENAAPFVEAADFFLVMTAEEDGAGQLFRSSALPRIRAARELLGESKAVWVDGGIGEKELRLIHDAGADTAVMGRAVVRAEDPLEQILYFSRLP